jgi:hypothetical protein
MKKRIPGPLWIAVVALGLIVLLHLGQGLKTGSVALFGSATFEIVLIVGLVLCQKWAYILILIFAVLGVAAGIAQNLTQGIAILVANAIVVVPMVM